MASFNQAIVAGHLGQDPRANQAGTKADFSLATNERRKNPQTDEWEDHTEWHRIVCFGKTAENVVRYLKKGAPALVAGRLQSREYRDRDGVDRKVVEIVADRVQFLGAAGDADARPAAGRRQDPPRPAPAPPSAAEISDDDIPF